MSKFPHHTKKIVNYASVQRSYDRRNAHALYILPFSLECLIGFLIGLIRFTSRKAGPGLVPIYSYLPVEITGRKIRVSDVHQLRISALAEAKETGWGEPSFIAAACLAQASASSLPVMPWWPGIQRRIQRVVLPARLFSMCLRSIVSAEPLWLLLLLLLLMRLQHRQCVFLGLIVPQ